MPLLGTGVKNRAYSISTAAILSRGGERTILLSATSLHLYSARAYWRTHVLRGTAKGAGHRGARSNLQAPPRPHGSDTGARHCCRPGRSGLAARDHPPAWRTADTHGLELRDERLAVDNKGLANLVFTERAHELDGAPASYVEHCLEDGPVNHRSGQSVEFVNYAEVLETGLAACKCF